MALDHKLLEIVACPVCKGKLNYEWLNAANLVAAPA